MFVPAAPPTVAAEPAVAAEPMVVTRRPLRRAAIATAFVAAAAAGIMAGSSNVFKRADDRPSFEADPSRAAASAAATTGVTAPKTTIASPTATVAPPSATVASPSPPPATAARRPARTKKSTEEGVFAPSRTFAWVPVQGAEEYRVRFYRGGRVVLERRAERARFVLPRGFEFRPGAYRWTVEPRLGGTYDPAVVDSRFEVTG